MGPSLHAGALSRGLLGPIVVLLLRDGLFLAKELRLAVAEILPNRLPSRVRTNALKRSWVRAISARQGTCSPVRTVNRTTSMRAYQSVSSP
jgi:hypothetical protein